MKKIRSKVSQPGQHMKDVARTFITDRFSAKKSLDGFWYKFTVFSDLPTAGPELMIYGQFGKFRDKLEFSCLS